MEQIIGSLFNEKCWYHSSWNGIECAEVEGRHAGGVFGAKPEGGNSLASNGKVKAKDKKAPGAPAGKPKSGAPGPKN
jgi:hypothetical protein